MPAQPRPAGTVPLDAPGTHAPLEPNPLDGPRGTAAPRPARTSGPLLQALGGLAVVAAMVLLAFVPDQPTALTTTITLITFGLPVLVAATVWWGGWPFAHLGRAAGGFATLALLVVSTFALTVVGTAVTGRVDVAGWFGAQGAYPVFPYGFVLAACVFVSMLQVTFVGQKVPFDRLSPVAGGLLAIATAWALGLAQYLFLLTWQTDAPGTPPAPPTATSGPVYALDWPTQLLCVVVFQVTVFILLDGWPFTAIRGRWTRFAASHVGVVAAGLLLARGLQSAGVDGGEVSAAAGAVAGAVLTQAMLFEGRPWRSLPPAAARVGLLVGAAVLATAYDLVLHAVGGALYPDDAAVPLPLWIAGTLLNLVAAGVIVHVAVFRRWPLPPARQG